jgi:hypothetical protein
VETYTEVEVEEVTKDVDEEDEATLAKETVEEVTKAVDKEDKETLAKDKVEDNITASIVGRTTTSIPISQSKT